MRSCIYCGKELAKDEQCDCYSARARRTNNTQQSAPNNNKKTSGTNNYFHKKNTNSYHTGYTKRENPLKSAWTRYCTRKYAARGNQERYKKSPRRNIIFDFVSFFKAPITSATNTSHISTGFVFVIAAASGALLGICAYLILLSVIHSTSLITSALPLAIWSGNEILSGAIFSALTGIVAGIALYSLYSVSFYLINRLIFRDPTKFSDFFRSLALCPLPIAISGIIGVLFGLVSVSAMVIIILCGLLFFVLLTYEVLKIKWFGLSNNQVIYGTLLGLLIFGMIMVSLISGI